MRLRLFLGMVFINKPQTKMLPEHPRKVLTIVNIHKVMREIDLVNLWVFNCVLNQEK